MFSIIICTHNRPEKINECVKSVFAQNIKNWELIVIDLSTDKKTKKILSKYSKKEFRYFKLKHNVKTEGLNFGIKKSKGEICAFTDDDCIVPPNWLKTANNFFSNNPDASALFGQVKSYRPRLHKDEACPSTFYITKTHIIKNTVYHAKHIGFGNNMFIRKRAIKKVGLFKNWLGPGAIGRTAEDAEMAIRLLRNNLKIISAKELYVYHNRWLNNNDFKKLEKDYFFGEMVCYGYLALKGEGFAGKLVYKNIKMVASQKKDWAIGHLNRKAKKIFKLLTS